MINLQNQQLDELIKQVGEDSEPADFVDVPRLVDDLGFLDRLMNGAMEPAEYRRFLAELDSDAYSRSAIASLIRSGALSFDYPDAWNRWIEDAPVAAGSGPFDSGSTNPEAATDSVTPRTESFANPVAPTNGSPSAENTGSLMTWLSSRLRSMQRVGFVAATAFACLVAVVLWPQSKTETPVVVVNENPFRHVAMKTSAATSLEAYATELGQVGEREFADPDPELEADEKRLLDAVSATPDSLESVVHLADFYAQHLKQSRTYADGAIKYFTRATELKPADPAYHIGLGSVQFFRNELWFENDGDIAERGARALPHFERAIELDRSSVAAHLSAARCHDLMGGAEAASKLRDTARELELKHPQE